MTSSADSPRPIALDVRSSRRPRVERRRPTPGRFASVPITVRVGVPLLLLVWLAVRFWPRSVAIEAVGFLGASAQVDGLSFEVFPFDDSGGGDYPPRAVAARTLGGGAASLSRDELGPAGVYLRADSPVHGVACTFVAPDRERIEFEFGAPRSLVGQVIDADGKGVEGARVVVLPHRYGPELGEGRTAADGTFAVPSLSSSASCYVARVLRTGFAAVDADVQLVEGSPVTLTLTRSPPVRGRVVLPASVPTKELTVRAFRCPGVAATVESDGRFVLDSLPPPSVRVRLMVHGAPAELTHAVTYASAGDEGVELTLVPGATLRGFVVTADHDQAVPGAFVHHVHGPAGGAGTYADSSGRFELGGLPPGRIRLDAFGAARRVVAAPGEPASTQVPFGFVEVDVVEGQAQDGVVLRIH
ncbi:MAG: carboxypeptidase regulatory-like domain-containing protein [Planctomycetota bacterium]